MRSEEVVHYATAEPERLHQCLQANLLRGGST